MCFCGWWDGFVDGELLGSRERTWDCVLATEVLMPFGMLGNPSSCASGSQTTFRTAAGGIQIFNPSFQRIGKHPCRP